MAILVQIYYWILPAWNRPTILSRQVKQAEYQTVGSKSGVSVVICVHRDVKKLKKLLQSLYGQSYPLYEIIVVNDGPQKDITEYLKSQSHNSLLKVLEFDSVTKITPGKKEPLTAGIQMARYDWILLTDGDCVPGPQWISEMLHHVTPDTEMVLGIAPFFARPGFLNHTQRFDSFITAVQYIGAAIRGKPYMGVGRNLLYHRSLFDSVNGFTKHAHLISGDDDLFVQSVANHKNTSVCMDPSGFVFSEAPITWKDWIFQKRRHLSASKAYTFNAKQQTTLFALSWGLVWTGLPFTFCSGMYWLFAGVLFITVLWYLFARIAERLQHQELIPWFPVLAISYCVELCTFVILLILPAPRKWMKS